MFKSRLLLAISICLFLVSLIGMTSAGFAKDLGDDATACCNYSMPDDAADSEAIIPLIVPSLAKLAIQPRLPVTFITSYVNPDVTPPLKPPRA